MLNTCDVQKIEFLMHKNSEQEFTTMTSADLVVFFEKLCGILSIYEWRPSLLGSFFAKFQFHSFM